MARTDAPGDTESILAAARRQPAPVYLLIGEPFQTEAVARDLIDLLVPAERRSFNLETYDGRSTAIGPILDSLRMPGLFAGTKVIWVREPTLFLSGEKRTDVTSAMFTAWSEDRFAEAADKLLVLAALAGWKQEQFSTADWVKVSKTEANSIFGRSIDEGEREALNAIRAHCAERKLTVAAHRDESGLLEEFLGSGVTPNTVLLFTAAAVDRRKRLVKTIRDMGAVAEFSLSRERSGVLSQESVEQLMERTLSREGKSIAPGGRRLIVQRAGSNPGQLVMELEKLCLYVGDSPTISEADVRASVRDAAESWIFDFTAALAQRQAAAAVSLLRALFEQGEHPLRVLALIARELRLLLLARDCLTDTLAGMWTSRTPFQVFRDRMLPMLSEEQREAFGGLHPYALYRCLQNASRASTRALQRGVLALQELDITLKSTPADPRLRLEAFVLNMCRETKPRAPSGLASEGFSRTMDEPD